MRIKRLDIRVREQVGHKRTRLVERRRWTTGEYKLNPSGHRIWVPAKVVTYNERVHGPNVSVPGIQVQVAEAEYAPTAIDPERFVRVSRRVPKRVRRVFSRPGRRPDDLEVVTDVVKTILDARLR